MRKLILFFSIAFVTILNVSCDKVLKVKPQNIVTSAQIFSSKASVKAEFATLYDEMPLEDFNYHGDNGDFHDYTQARGTVLSGLTVENKDHNINTIPGDGTWLGWWSDGYSAIRDINKFISNVKKADFNQDQIDRWLGEALFIRAFDYFGLVKRYGGVPLITEVQNFTGDNLDELQVSRDKEKEVYDFISTQLDSAAALMGSTSPGAGRANKYVALALKSRAMLFAASEAEYGHVRLHGLIGIPASDAKQYWKQAYNAADKVIESGKYSLYNKYPNDHAKNFQQLFLHAKDNPEVILAKYYKYPEKGHSFDLWRLPYEYESPDGYSSDDAPSLQFVEAFNYIDGSNGKLKIKDSQGKKIEYKDPLDIFKNKDPRLFASVILPNSKWRGKTVHVRAGIIANGQTMTTGNFDDTYKGMHIIGASGIGGGEVSQTGFYLRKHMNPDYSSSSVSASPAAVSGGSSSQPWIEFRLGGVLLNYSEAAVELGKNDDGGKALNRLHERAGIAEVKPSQITIQAVRHERKVELFGEWKYYWDMKRWHIADKILDNYKVEALYPYYVYKDKAYIFKRKKVGYPETFHSKMYYLKIPTGEIEKDPNLKQNPGY